MKKTLLFIITCLSTHLSNAQQDRHYSMFYLSPMALNPGATGIFEGDYQFFAGYKNQWGSISPNLFKTISASFDGKFLNQNGNFLGAGLNFYNDISGESRLTSNVVNISLSYALEIARNQKISLGIQPGFIQRYIKNDNLIWDNQWNGSNFDANINSNENLGAQSGLSFDVNTGLYYYGKINSNSTLYGGVAGSHLLTPENSLIQSGEKLYRKLTFNIGGEFRVNQGKMAFLPNAYFFKQGPNSEYVVGMDYKYVLKESSKYTGYNDETSLMIGGYYRFGDAFFPTVLVNYANFTFGVSYDINLSGLSVATNGLGGMELALRYRIVSESNSSARFL